MGGGGGGNVRKPVSLAVVDVQTSYKSATKMQNGDFACVCVAGPGSTGW